MGIATFFQKKRKDPTNTSPAPSTPSQENASGDLDGDFDENDVYDPNVADIALGPAAKRDTSESNYKPAPPRRTTFNKTLVLGGIALLLISAAGAMIYELQSPVQKKGKVEQEAPAPKRQTDNFSDIPSNYSSIKDPNSKTPAKPNAAIIPTGPTGKMPPAPQVPVGSGPPLVSLAEREALAARNSPIGFGGNNSGSTASAAAQVNPFLQQMMAANAAAQGPGAGNGGATSEQDQKLAFFEKNRTAAWYVKGNLTPAVSEYEVKAGAVIPGVMLTGIKSDLPGQIVGQVRENVYDSKTGQYLLIPQGTKIIGTYDSKVTYGQERVLLVWSRIIFPNGESLDLESMGGVDSAGYSGLSDHTNNHTGKLITGILLGTVATAGATVAAGKTNSDNITFGQAAAQGAATNVSNAVADITRKNLNIQPTIEIRPGWKFNVFVNKDLILKPYME